MKQLLVLKDVAIKAAGATNPTALVDGGLGIYEFGVSKASVPAGSEVQIAVGIGGSDCLISKTLKAGSSVVKTTIDYAAGSKHIAAFDAVAAAISSITDEYVVKVVDTTTGKADEDHSTYVVSGEFASDDALAAAIAASINADADAVVVASVSGNTVTLTAKEFNAHFRVAFQEELEGTAVTYTPFVAQVGTEAQIKELEAYCNTYQGNTDKIFKYSKSAPSRVSGNYDLVRVVVETPIHDKSGMHGKVYDRSEIYIAIPDGASAVTPALVQTALTNL